MKSEQLMGFMKEANEIEGVYPKVSPDELTNVVFLLLKRVVYLEERVETLEVEFCRRV